MKKRVSIILILYIFAIVLTACGGISDKKLNQALEEIGTMEFADMGLVSDEEKSTLKEFQTRKDDRKCR